MLCVFSDSIYSARDFQKLSTTSVTAFGGRDFGMMGYVLDRNVLLYNMSLKPHTTNSEFSIDGIDTLPKVGILIFHVDADPDLVYAAGEEALRADLVAGDAVQSQRAYRDYHKCQASRISCTAGRTGHPAAKLWGKYSTGRRKREALPGKCRKKQNGFVLSAEKRKICAKNNKVPVYSRKGK